MFLHKSVHLFLPIDSVRNKSILQFLSCNTTNRGILRLHTDIIQLIQITEHTDLRKLSHTGKENKTKITVRTFQYTIEGLQCLTIVIKQSVITQCLQQRFIIFIHQDYDSTTRLFTGSANYTRKTSGESFLILPLPYFSSHCVNCLLRISTKAWGESYFSAFKSK